MTYLYKPLIRKNFKTGEKMYYPAPPTSGHYQL